ncbi:MAG TPA: hypothetical protein VFM31_01155 [Nitrososphaeraceae archaeon]|nr:hypothetical protein [Nitrososphaeraceae archaeon]
MKIVKSFPEKDQILVKNCLKARAEYQDIPGSSFYIAPPESDESFLGQLINSILCSSANK